MATLQEKVLALYEFVRMNLYLTAEDLTIGRRSFSSTLLFVILGFITRMNVLLLGEYGTGKTTSAELVGSVLAGIPLNVVIQSEVRASPEITDQTLKARPHLGKLNQGIEEVRWTFFVKCPIHIIDELPRMPEIKQAMILEGIRTGQWIYLGQLLSTKKTSLFATGNWDSLGGSFDLTPALRDRFGVAVETFYSGARISARIASLRAEEAIKGFGLNDFADDAVELLNHTYDAATLSQFSEKFKGHIADRGVPTISEDEFDAARKEITALQFSPDASLFFEFLISSLNFCIRTGQKRSTRFGEGAVSTDCPEDCRFNGTACSRVRNGGSRRKERDIRLLSQALAWIMGDSQVQIAHLKVVAPFALWHRATFSSNFLGELKNQERMLPSDLEAARRYVDQLHSEFKVRKVMIIEVLDYIERQPAEAALGRITVHGRTYTDQQLPHPFLIDCVRHARGTRSLVEV